MRIRPTGSSRKKRPPSICDSELLTVLRNNLPGVLVNVVEINTIPLLTEIRVKIQIFNLTLTEPASPMSLLRGRPVHLRLEPRHLTQVNVNRTVIVLMCDSRDRLQRRKITDFLSALTDSSHQRVLTH